MKVIHIYMFKRVYTLHIITIIVVCNYTNCSEYFVQKHVFFRRVFTIIFIKWILFFCQNSSFSTSFSTCPDLTEDCLINLDSWLVAILLIEVPVKEVPAIYWGVPVIWIEVPVIYRYILVINTNTPLRNCRSSADFD